MPQKVVYVSRENLETWDEAKRINEGSMSQLINYLIADFVFKCEEAEEDEEASAGGEREEVAA